MNISHDTIRHILEKYDCVPVNAGSFVTVDNYDYLLAEWEKAPEVYAPLEDFEFELCHDTIKVTGDIGKLDVGFRFYVNGYRDAQQLQQLILNG